MADDITAMQGQLASLKEALRSGAQSVSYEGKSVSYRTSADMQAVINALERSLNIDARPRRVVVRTSKGW